MEALPPMTASELHELFNRYVDSERVAQARVAFADSIEHESVCRIRELRRRWAQLRWKP